MSKYLITLLFPIVLLSHCTGYTPSGPWYLEGDSLKFDFIENRLVVSEHSQLVFQARQVGSSEDSTYEIIKLGPNPIIQEKYSLNQRLIFRKLLLKDKEITLVMDHSRGQRKYRLFRQKHQMKLSYFSLLHPVEQKEFLEDPDFIPLRKEYKIEAYTSNLKDLNLSFLTDGDLKTSWSHKGLNYLSKDYFEFFFIL